MKRLIKMLGMIEAMRHKSIILKDYKEIEMLYHFARMSPKKLTYQNKEIPLLKRNLQKYYHLTQPQLMALIFTKIQIIPKRKKINKIITSIEDKIKSEFGYMLK